MKHRQARASDTQRMQWRVMEAAKARLEKPPSSELIQAEHLLGDVPMERCSGAAQALPRSAGQGQLGYGLQVS